MAPRSSSGKSNAALDPALPQKKRARRRLVGAAAVCLAAAIALPMLLDSEPRQIRGDVQIRIPSRDTPLVERDEAQTRSGPIVPAAPAGDRAAGEPLPGSARADPAPAPEEPTKSADRAPQADAQDAGSAPPTAERPVERPRETPQAKQPPAQDPIAKLAQEKDPPAQAPGGFVVQIGAFSSAKGASAQADRARKAGFKAYTETVKTAQGERVRVRVGPFETREAADQARAKLRAAGVESVLVAP